VKTSAKVLLTGKDLTLSDLVMVALFNKPMEIKISAAVDESEKLLNDKLAQNYFLYGVNTNFGKDVSLLVQPEQMEELQRNLIRSLLCGASISDELLPMPIIKGAMLARINCLAFRPLRESLHLLAAMRISKAILGSRRNQCLQ